MSVPNNYHSASKRTNYTRIIKDMEKGKLNPRGEVVATSDGWRLEIPAGARGTYRLSQLDDYAALRRDRFPHVPPLTINLRARVSAADLPGTWGFGVWNDPFGLSLGFGGNSGRLPALPQAAWFFYGSIENYLSFRDDLPANGFFAGTFRSPAIPSLLLAPAALALPFLPFRPISRWMRRLASKLILQGGVPVEANVKEWHDYKISWQRDGCSFFVDGQSILETPISPRGRLGLVIWIDNQYAFWRPDGRLGWGMLENPKAWMEIEGLEISGTSL
jgi:hypothetical protein